MRPRRIGHERLAFHASASLVDMVHRAAIRRRLPTAAFLREVVGDAVGHEDGAAPTPTLPHQDSEPGGRQP